MERLDFASVMAVLRRNIPDEDFSNQADFFICCLRTLQVQILG